MSILPIIAIVLLIVIRENKCNAAPGVTRSEKTKKEERIPKKFYLLQELVDRDD